ncbi:hypothetical protein CEB3_c48210 [Peptococcaceae bacterium CEB3]|nr:hypothetical protein CEB3_c48210 [Peptococcaceae bacterium CEB3]
MKTQIERAIVNRDGQPLAVVSVHSFVFQSATDATNIIKSLLPSFGGIPVVLMTLNAKGEPGYFGRPDLVSFLETIPVQEMAWEPLTVDLDLYKPQSFEDIEI